MRINEIITEAKGISASQIAGIIRRDCALYLAEIDSNPELYKLWRGISTKIPGFAKHPCPVNRPPRDTEPGVAAIVDQWFFDKFGVRFRSNATFATGSLKEVESYSHTYYIFPIGKFSFCWSDMVNDMTYDLLDVTDATEDNPKRIVELLAGAGYTANSSMIAAIKSGHEIMIHCPEGYYTLALAQYDRSSNDVNNISEEVITLLSHPADKADELNKQRHISRLVDQINKTNRIMQQREQVLDALKRCATIPDIVERSVVVNSIGNSHYFMSDLEDNTLPESIRVLSDLIATTRKKYNAMQKQLKVYSHENNRNYNRGRK